METRRFLIPQRETLSQGWDQPMDPRWLYAEIATLRQQLSATQTHCGQRLESMRQHCERSIEQHRCVLNEQLESLNNDLAAAHGKVEQTNLRAKRDLALASNELESCRASLGTSREQVVSLHAELKHLAETAAAEQHELRQSQQLERERHHALLRDRDVTIEKLRSQIEDQEGILEHWKVAQGQAVGLSEWYEREHQKGLHDRARLRAEYDRFRSRTSEAFAICEQEIETLEAKVSILSTDHEAVELINADLDHRNDQLLCDIDYLQRDLETFVSHATRDQQHSLSAIKALDAQLHETNVRWITSSQEQKSLIETVAKLRVTADDFDASLFAKDQEIAATAKVATETRRQLEQLRREHEIALNQNEAMRIRIRESGHDVSRMQAQLTETAERVDIADSKLAQREQQIRELQSASRAAEANADLRASEAEQQYSIELQRLEQELEQHQDSRERDLQTIASLQSRIAEMEAAHSLSRQTETASSAENNQLQQTIDQLKDRLRESETAVQLKSQRVEMLDEIVRDLHAQRTNRSDEVSQFRVELGERRVAMAELADRIAIQQNTIVQLGQELQQSHLDCSQLRQSQSHQTAAAERIRQLEAELAGWKLYENPRGEVIRLTAELARLTAQAAGEREAFQRRIEQLQTQYIVYRAA